VCLPVLEFPDPTMQVNFPHLVLDVLQKFKYTRWLAEINKIMSAVLTFYCEVRYLFYLSVAISGIMVTVTELVFNSIL